MVDSYNSLYFSINESYVYMKSCTDIISYIWLLNKSRYTINTPKTILQSIKLCQTPKAEYFPMIINDLKPLSIFAK